ncbi:uncharacterized protein LOC143850612 [Tasmannia lanceolata]|uniref:uncharacterized protein LOC143850612 n=1 Tax=Tasmannia lanceolata TaxID=3420 RepID=UPI004063695D
MGFQELQVKSIVTSLRTTCHCGQPAPIRTSWTSSNFGRRFLGCSGYEINAACKFFEWIDPLICAQGSVVVARVMETQKKLHLEVARLEAEVAVYRRREKLFQTLIGISCGGTLLFVMLLFFVVYVKGSGNGRNMKI